MATDPQNLAAQADELLQRSLEDGGIIEHEVTKEGRRVKRHSLDQIVKAQAILQARAARSSASMFSVAEFRNPR